MKHVCTRLGSMVMALICLTAMLAISASAKTDLPTVISQAQKGVVKLFVVGFDDDRQPVVAGVVSGFAVGQKGTDPQYFVTNWHVASSYLEEYNYAFDPAMSGSESRWTVSPSATSPACPARRPPWNAASWTSPKAATRITPF